MPDIVKAGCLTCTRTEMKRRDFIRAGSLTLFGLSLSQFLQLRASAGVENVNRAAKAQSVIFVWLEGGQSQVDSWDPKPNSNFNPIGTNVEGIQISELYPGVARHLDKLSIIRSMHGEEDNHPEATSYAMTGHRPSPSMKFPSVGAIVTKELGPINEVPPHVLLPEWTTEKQYEKFWDGAFLGPDTNPLVVPDPSKPDYKVVDLTLPKSIDLKRVENRRSFLQMWDQFHRQKVAMAEYEAMDTFREQALEMILAPAVRDAFDISKEPDELRDRYGRDQVGQSLLLARRLVEAGTRFVTASGFHMNSWDTHGDHDQRNRDKLAPPLDKGLSALIGDLDERGLLESTIVICMGEFGRTPHINVKSGRDHWMHCWSCLVGGGGLASAKIIGASDDQGGQVAEQPVSIGDLYATIYKALGIDWNKTYMTSIGRPINLANAIDDETGQPLAGLI